MDTFLQPVDVPERCFLEEVLYWVAFQRLPVVFHLNGLGDLRDSEDWGTYNVDFIDSTLSEDETARAGIPTDPDWIARVQWENDNLPADRDPGEGSSLKKAWLPHYHRAIVGPVAKITTALMQGSLRAKGRLLRNSVSDFLSGCSNEFFVVRREFFANGGTAWPNAFCLLKPLLEMLNSGFLLLG